MRITRRFSFEACHKLLKHPGKCRNYHGHSYKLFVTLEGKPDAGTGMILDFSDIKRIVNENIIEKYDHRDLNDYFHLSTAENIGKQIFEILQAEFELPFDDTEISNYLDILNVDWDIFGADLKTPEKAEDEGTALKVENKEILPFLYLQRTMRWYRSAL